jgi:DNA-directed RNA polymerase subunit RPC12/RpoP
MCDIDYIRCKCCGDCNTLEECGVVGACDGNVFCATCSSEIESDSGLPAILCGSCDSCKELKEDGDFYEIQARRYEDRRECFE